MPYGGPLRASPGFLRGRVSGRQVGVDTCLFRAYNSCNYYYVV